MIEIRDVVKTFDGFRALDGVTMTVPRGAVYGLVGPNGAGKSTLIRHLTGIYRPDSGTIDIDGQPVYENPAVKARIAYIPDDVFYFPQATIPDMMRYYRGIYPKFDAERYQKLGEVFQLDPKRQIRRLSKGMQKQAAFWLAMCLRPDVLVLDEPTSYLDIRYQIDLLRILRHLAKSRNVAVIMSIHELELAQKSADKVICVKDGRVFRAGAPEDIFTRETIGELYGLQHGTFNGSVEIGRPHGDAHPFVIAGAGTGSAVFRQLIRQGKAFYAGVLHEGDIDCELARDLAAECVAERAFEPIGDKTIARAKELLVHCARLIVCPAAFGTINARNVELVEFARSHGIEVMRACEGASEDSQ